jgi:glycosyltransferase involved in cell wall biosynthesis
MMLDVADSQQATQLRDSSGHRLPWRVALCTNFLPPYRLAVLKMLANAFQSFRVLVSTEMEEDRPWTADCGGMPVIRQRTISLKNSTRHPNGFNQSQTVHIPYDTCSLLHQLRPNVVISVEFGVRSLLSAFYCAVVRSCRLVIWADLSEVTEAGRGPARKWLRRWLIRRASAILVNGASGRRYVEALGGPSERIHTIPYTTDVDLFLTRPLYREPALRRRLLYVGRLIRPKGLLSFLDVCTRWCRQHPSRTLEVLFVGDGELWSVLETFQPPHNLHIQLEHSVPYSDLPGIYQRAGVLVLPTLADTWALVVSEAMAAGLPVLGSVYSQAVDEMVIDGVNGWSFRSDDPEDSFRALSQVMDCSDDELAAMGKHARATSAAIRPELVASLVTDVVTKVCRSRGALLTNMVAPYRIPIYGAIGRAFDLTVLTSKHERNRRHWDARAGQSLSVRQSSGILLTLRKKASGRTFDYKYLQLPFGAFFDLFRLRPDWIISAEMGLRTLIALFYSWLCRTPLWVWWGGTKTTERHIGFLKRTIRKFLAKRVKHWISYGRSSTDYLNSIGVSSSRILTIQNCAADHSEIDRFPRSVRSSDKPRFLCVGQLIGRKGVDAMIRSLASLQAEGLSCSLTLLGSGPEHSNLQRLASELRLEEVYFMGETRPEDMRHVYAQADCVVFPTMEDVWGLVVNEAILAGVPVLCSIHAGCVDELVPPEYRFDPLDPESIKRALRTAFRGAVRPIPKSVLRTPESVAQDIIAAIDAELDKTSSVVQETAVPV